MSLSSGSVVLFVLIEVNEEHVAETDKALEKHIGCNRSFQNKKWISEVVFNGIVLKRQFEI